MPSTRQVIDYVTKHPGCKSKDIAAALGCPKQEINKRSGSYPGIYAIPEIKHEDFKHYPASAVLDDEQSCIYDVLMPAGVDDCIIDALQQQIRELQERNKELQARLEKQEAEHEERVDRLEERADRLEEQVQRLVENITKPRLKPKLKPKESAGAGE